MTGLPLALFAALLICFSQTCMRAASDSVRVFADAVMPALFPMLVVAGLGTEDGATNTVAARFLKTELLLFGWLAGSPASARRVQRAMMHEGLSLSTAHWLCVTAGTMSPMFFLGALAKWLGSTPVAALMLLAHWLSALLVGWLAAALQKRQDAPGGDVKPDGSAPPVAAAPKAIDERSSALLYALPAALMAAARSLLAVCGAMMLFSILGALAQSVLVLLFPALHNASLPFAMGRALLEIGGGAHAVTQTREASPAILCALCGFGGLSLWVQNLLFTREIIRPVRLLGWRIVHAVLSYGLCRLFLLLYPVGSAVMGGVSPALPGLSPLCRLMLGSVLALLSLWARRSRICWRRS